MLYQVYWYHLASHTSPHKEGYVGVTKQNDVRRRCHLNGKRGSAKILHKAFKKYGVDCVIQSILHTVDSKEEAYELEMAYRPYPSIGWNLAIGGGMPPDTTGRKDSVEVCAKRAESVRKAKANKSYPSIFKGMTDRHDALRRASIGEQHRGKTISTAHRMAILEKLSYENHPHAEEVFIVHKDSPEHVHHFHCIKSAAETLGIPYNTLRSVAQRTIRNNQSSEPSRTGWLCLTGQDAKEPIVAVTKSIELRRSRFIQMAREREANRKLKVPE